MKSAKNPVLSGQKRPLIRRKFKPYQTIGAEEIRAVNRVMKTGELSKFLGAWSDHFYGGREVQAFEKRWADYFQIPYAVSVNSATSGLMAALGAIGLEPGDEVITSPWTMCASATSVLVWNAIPVFADIKAATFNLDPASIRKNITPYTKAIVVPNIFGHPADLNEIMAIAAEHQLKVIEDNAQAPGALYHGKYAGTVADIGVFSLNYHKHIHTGEGGVCVTRNANLAERMQLIRNHAEAAAGPKGVSDFSNLIGHNFRLTEIQAAIGSEQLKKLNGLIKKRQTVIETLSEGLRNLPGLRIPVIERGCTHVFYHYGLKLNPEELGVSKLKIAAALNAEGVPGAFCQYANVHLLPIFQKKIAFGSHGFPWKTPFYRGNVKYDKGICPVAENLQDFEFLGIPVCLYDLTLSDAVLIAKAFHKVWQRRHTL